MTEGKQSQILVLGLRQELTKNVMENYSIFFICAYRKHCFGFRPVHFCTMFQSFSIFVIAKFLKIQIVKFFQTPCS